MENNLYKNIQMFCKAYIILATCESSATSFIVVKEQLYVCKESIRTGRM